MNSDLIWFSQFANGFPAETETEFDLSDADTEIDINIEFERMDFLPIPAEQIQCIQVSIMFFVVVGVVVKFFIFVSQTVDSNSFSIFHSQSNAHWFNVWIGWSSKGYR